MSQKTILLLHVLSNILAQGAIIALVPSGWPEKVFQAAVAVIGVFVAFYDTTSSALPPTSPTA